MVPLDDVMQPPFLTSDLPGIGGKIKVIPEDFEVEEIPAYEPSGQGDFLYLWLEKRGMGAEYFTRQIARRLDIPVGEVGTAGLKDRHAVTRQMVSVPAVAEANLPKLEGDGISVLRVSKHTNKLRPGHLHGNRFRILIREPANADPAVIASLLDRLRNHGLPNYYGSQRFGRDGETLQTGLALLHGEKTARPVRTPFLRKLALSAAQSALFNHYLAQRGRDGLFRRVLPGDVMCKIPFGGMFVAADVETEQKRFDAREIVSAGPIFGRKTFAAAQVAAERETVVLTAFGLSAASFAGFGKLVDGTRRHNLVYVDDLVANVETEGVRVSFTLPAGCYATILLREMMKIDVGEEDPN
jgi:tRNA pseudouridine13 synthase